MLMIGEDAVIEVTGLRNPCAQLDQFQQGLTSAVLDRDEHGETIRLAGVMGVVINGGRVIPGDPVSVRVPHGPLRPLMPV
jgi:MOSC domain-containing protein YiiM